MNQLTKNLLAAAERVNNQTKEFMNPWGKPETGFMLLQKLWRKEEDKASRLRMQSF